MDAFSYLSVLLSIILGLAITQVLQGFRGLMLARHRVQTYWPCLGWAVLLLVIDVQVWWAMYQLRERVDWSFIGFAVVLAQTVPLYLLAGLVMPDVAADGPVDLRAHYYANHRWFFVILALLLVASIAKQLMLAQRLPPPLDLGVQLLLLLFSVTGACTARERYHKIMMPVAAIVFLGYIAALFSHLH